MSFTERARALIDRIDNLAARTDDGADERLNKTILLFLGVFAVLATPLAALQCRKQGATAAAIWLAGCTALLGAGLIQFLVAKDRRVFQALQLSLILVTPPLLQRWLGGYAAAGAVSLWALLAPLGALMFYGPRASVGWFAAFLLLSLLNGALEPDALWFTENLLLAAMLVFILLRHFVKERERLRAELAREQEKSEQLLLSILPAPIADRLKQERRVIADGFADVTVLFADLVGFTELSARTDPARLVSLLNDLFSRFDALSDRHGTEKIKTIGDAYMACAGLPVMRADHAEAAAHLALDMLDAMRAFNLERGLALNIRIGINSGPVVAGVIGLKKFIYDLWGDTVNTASRMESHGKPGAIQISATTWVHLKDKFRVEARGRIAIKGKGETETYWLVGPAT